MTWPYFGDITALSVFTNILDIAIVTFLIYKLLMLIRGTRAVQLIRGIIILFILLNLSSIIHLHTFSWLLDQVWAVIFLALAVIFQPELRRALEQIGRGQIISHNSAGVSTSDIIQMINEIVAAATYCSKTKTGLLLVMERETGLNDYIETGINVDAVVSEEMILNIFAINTPLHDGASIIRGNRIISAACFLPLTDNPYISTTVGTRHRAAIGISEISDAVCLVVSEETGTISLARDGKLVRSLDEKQLREILNTDLIGVSTISKIFRIKRREG